MSDEFDIQSFLDQAQELTQRLSEAQVGAGDETFDGTAGGGKVVVTMLGTGAIKAVRLDPSVVDPNDIEMLEDLIVAAAHDAANKVTTWAQEQMASGMGLLGGLGDLIGGGGLDALFGGAPGGAIEVQSSEPDQP
jgi:nucleoid-associated protein EbfC